MVFLSQIRALAINVWREATRDRLLHVLTGSGIVLMLAAIVFGEMAVGGPNRIVQNMGFWILGIWGLAAVLYLGSNIVRREFQQKTVYLVLSRPIERPTFLIGKFFGMALVLLSAFCLLVPPYLILLQFHSVPITVWHFWALACIFGEWILLSAVSLFFASFTTPMLHNFFLVGIMFLGHWSNDLRLFSENAKSEWIKLFLKGIYYALPNLEALNFREAALYNEAIKPGLLTGGATVLAFWILLSLTAANLIFSQRKLL